MENKSPYPTKLDLNAAFLSTRNIELPRLTTGRSSWDTCNRVPFSWEQTPGKPKGGCKANKTEHIDVPPPKLPPCKWHPPAELPVNQDDVDEGFDGYVDDDCERHRLNYGDSSYTIDIFSLSESVDFFDREFDTRESSATQSPSYIIQRYLSDVKALAAASSAVIPDTRSSNYRYSRTVGQSYSSPKSCGLDMFFPWRMKHKLCGVKIPVNSTRKKHKCLLSVTPFG